MKIICAGCSAELSFMNIRRLADLDGNRLGSYCKTCFPAAEHEIQKERFVEEYKGNKIYSLDGKFTPYWGCWYYFKSLEDTKARIDNSYQAYVDAEMFRFLNK